MKTYLISIKMTSLIFFDLFNVFSIKNFGLSTPSLLMIYSILMSLPIWQGSIRLLTVKRNRDPRKQLGPVSYS